jgi:hypothetical protein
VGRIVTRRPWWVVGAYVLLAAASVLVSVLHLKLNTRQNDLISADLPYNQRFLAFREEFGNLEFLYVVIEADGRRELAMEVADAVAAELESVGDAIEEVHHHVRLESFADQMLLLEPEEDLEKLVAVLTQNASLLKLFEGVNGFDELLGFFANSFSPSLGEENPEFAAWGFNFLDATLGSLQDVALGRVPLPLETRIEEIAFESDPDPRRTGYLFSRNGALAFVEILPVKGFEHLESRPLEKIRQALARVRAKFPDVRLGLTGRPVLEVDEMATTSEDMKLAAVLALGCILVLYVLVFRRVRRPLLACIALLAAIAITFGFVTVTLGYLTLLSIVFAAMLIGLGTDFGVHLLERYQEELELSSDIARSIRKTLVTTGLGIWTGGLTTAVAFFVTLFVEFKGLAELGFVAGSGLLICLVTMLTLLPALVLITDRAIQHKRGLHPPHLIKIPSLVSAARHPKTTLAIFATLTLVGCAFLEGVPYDWNLLNLQARGLESVDYELKVIENSDRSTWYAAFTVPDLQSVDKTLEALEPAQAAGIVGSVESIRDFIRPEQKATIELLGRAQKVLSSPTSPAAPLPELQQERLGTSLDELLDKLDSLQSLAASRGTDSDVDAVNTLEGLIRRVDSVQERLSEDPESLARLRHYQPQWFAELSALRGKLHTMLRPPEITPESLPRQISRRLMSEDGQRFLVWAYPSKDIWEEQNMKDFVEATRRVNPEVTGTPIQVYESTRLMRNGFLKAALYSLIAVFLLVLVDFRDIRLAFLALVPIVIGLLWALQLMPLLGISFNLANFFALPILIGYGVDGGIHIIHRYREMHSTVDAVKTTGSAVALSSLTSIVGFGALSFAQHQGVASLGRVTALGCATVFVATVILLPAMIDIFTVQSGRKRRPGEQTHGSDTGSTTSRPSPKPTAR